MSDTMAARLAALMLRRLAIATVIALAVIAAPLAAAPWLSGMTAWRALAHAAIVTGAAGAALAASLLALAGLLASLAMARTRLRDGDAAGAKRMQGILVPTLALLAALPAWALRPSPAQPAPQDSFILAGLLLVLAFLALVAERMVAALRPAALPEAPALRCLMLVAVLALGLSGCLQIGGGAGLPWMAPPAAALCLLLGLIALELAMRALATWFLPPPPLATSRAPVASLLAEIIAGSIGRGGVSAPIRARFGIDFSRSWALLWLRAAALPALALTALLCWGLTGLVMVDLDQRGVTRLLGAPAGVLAPGLHLIPPWPFGGVTMVEFGSVHEIAIGAEQAAQLAAEKSPAEAPAPPSANRLWDQPHPGEVAYLIASQTTQSEQGDPGQTDRGQTDPGQTDRGQTDRGQTDPGQSFQTVNADIRVLYRVGLTDGDATRAATSVADPAALIRQTAGRRIARLFAARTLDAVLGERREAIAEQLRAAIASDLAPFDSGIEVVGVVVEAIHPPAGAAAAYHAVQAAAIGSRTAVAEAQGRARSAANETRQQTRQLADSAQAAAAETVQSAEAERVRFTADRAAHEAGGPVFLVERYFAALVAGLAKSPLTIIDDRIAGPAAQTIDLRPLAGGPTPPADDAD